MPEPKPYLYCSKGFTMEEIVRIYQKYCKDLNDPEDIWIEGYDEFLEYRSDIEIRKTELTSELKPIVRWCDQVVLRNGLHYIDIFGEGLYDDSYRKKRYPTTHWWWYLDKVKSGELPTPDIENGI
ncbi:hypothetical protein Ctha_1667 [Chloroherpeton thalassium ATCC 35110]|uniref:Uncharacterized protein n=1 Tax=Chloroherpeton thalassium (strain ATCC 35110 / GB-78) TaxID=517418 RepID=B3QSS8_CHLT3|nr:hypothetical protein [Chloroherpeton thalassium]ACF14125.1 hypothetical protein Ctha_1667 [Chloroherpeton thalassium ATCC 35110]